MMFWQISSVRVLACVLVCVSMCVRVSGLGIRCVLPTGQPVVLCLSGRRDRICS